MDVNKRRERASAEAAEWWLRFEAGELSLAHRQEFVDWLRESALHVAELLRIAEVHGVLERFQGWEGISADGWESSDSVVSISDATPRAPRSELAEAALEDARRHRSTRRWLVAGVAAAAIAGFGVWTALVARAEIIETGRGERRGVTLADGSVIQIDPQSRLRVRLDEHARNIELERGRALFRVARDPNRPFVVRADVTLVRAVGTQFGVEQAREGVVVTVAEGKVAVSPQNAEAISYGAAWRLFRSTSEHWAEW